MTDNVHDMTKYLAERTARILAEDAADRARVRMTRFLVASGVPLGKGDDVLLATGKYLATDATRAVDRWLASDDKPALMLCGGVGVGKTFAAAVALMRTRGTFCRAADLPRRVEPWRGEETADRLDLDVPLIVLDDLGAEGEAQHRFGSALFRVVDERQTAGRLLITTNLPRAGIRERYDARVVDRLNACCVAFELRGESMRPKSGGL